MPTIYLQCKCGHEFEYRDGLWREVKNIKAAIEDGNFAELECWECHRKGCWTVVEDTEAKPESILDMYGRDPDFTGGLTPEEFLRRQRGEESEIEDTEAEPEHTPGPQWVVQADPDWAGKHPYHDHRFITTAGFDLKSRNPDGEIVCRMTDSPNQAANAAFIVRACNSHADLLEALEKIMGYIADGVLVRDVGSDHQDDFHVRMARFVADLQIANSAIAKAKKGE